MAALDLEPTGPLVLSAFPQKPIAETASAVFHRASEVDGLPDLRSKQIMELPERKFPWATPNRRSITQEIQH